MGDSRADRAQGRVPSSNGGWRACRNDLDARSWRRDAGSTNGRDRDLAEAGGGTDRPLPFHLGLGSPQRRSVPRNTRNTEPPRGGRLAISRAKRSRALPDQADADAVVLGTAVARRLL